MSVDFGRLILLDALIVAVAGAVAWAAVRWRLNVTAAGLSLLAAGLVVVTAGVGWRLLNHWLDVAKQKSELEASRVAAADLKRVVVFDAIFSPNNGILEGRIKNELPRKIGSVELKLSFYNSNRELIEVQRAYLARFILADPRLLVALVALTNGVSSIC